MSSIRLEAPPSTLAIEWQPAQWDDPDTATEVIREPVTTVAKLFSLDDKEAAKLCAQAKLPVRPTLQQFYTFVQQMTVDTVNDRLLEVLPQIAEALNQQTHRERLQEQALRDLHQYVQMLHDELHRWATQDELQFMDWEPTPVQITPYKSFVETLEEQSTITSYQPSHGSPAPLFTDTEARTDTTPFRPQRDVFAESVLRHKASGTDRIQKPSSPPVTRAGPSKQPGKGPERTGAETVRLPLVVPRPRTEEAEGAPREDEEMREVGGQEGVGGSGGGQPPRGGVGAGGNPDDSPDDSDSDSDPEPDRRRQPNRWKKWHRRQDIKDMIKFVQLMNQGKTSEDIRPPDFDSFEGKPEYLHQFLSNCEDYFFLCPSKFRSKGRKVRFAGMKLKGAEMHKWWETYRAKFDAEVAYRIFGDRYTFEMDDSYLEWPKFKAQITASFGHKMTALQAEIEWRELQMGDSVDKYLDKLGRLQMILGLNDQAIDMKLRESMSAELRQRWAATPVKARAMSDRLRQLREIGHDIEDARNYEKHLKKVQGRSQPAAKEEKNSKPQKEFKIKGKAKEKSGRKGKDNSEFKDKKVELKGISQEVLDQRRKEDKCLKCGKGGHEWYKCWTKEPVTARVAGTKRKGGDLASRVWEPKKARVASSGETEAVPAGSAASGRIIELTEEDDIDLWAMMD